MNEDPTVALATKFGPILKAAFPKEHSRTRFDVAHALAEAALTTYRAEIEAATIERCAERAKCAFDDRPNSRSGHHSEMDWTDGYRDGTRAAEAAIRNLKGQTS